jgi:hypothetical protein
MRKSKKLLTTMEAQTIVACLNNRISISRLVGARPRHQSLMSAASEEPRNSHNGVSCGHAAQLA